MKPPRHAAFRLVLVLCVASFGTASLAAQDIPGTENPPPGAEAPLPLRIPQSAPPSPEVPLPDTSSLMPKNRIEWTGDIDPDLTWIGAPWDYLPPVHETKTGEGTPAQSSVPATQAPSAQSPPAPQATPPATPPVQPPTSGARATPTPPPQAAPGPSDAPGLSPAPAPSLAPPLSGSPELSEVMLAVDEVAALSLPGTGWIYVGSIPADADIDLIESQTGAGETLFRFRPRQTGDLLLSFQRQDMVTGGFEEATLALSVLQEVFSPPESVAMPDRRVPRGTPGADETPARQGTPPPTRVLEITTDGDGDYQEARRLLAEGRREDALESFLQHYDGTGTPELHQEIASLADDTGYDEIAHHFWEFNLRLPSEAGSAARRGLAEEQVRSASIRDLEEFFRLARNYDDMPSARRLFEWARLYDADGPSPDVSRALLLYRTLTDWYPGSPETPEAERRLRFLRRHFLEIR